MFKLSVGIITTIAGSSTSGAFSGDGGDATLAELRGPRGVILDSSGRQYKDSTTRFFPLIFCSLCFSR